MFRYVIAFAAAALITLGLFFLMQSLIQSSGSALTEPAQGKVLDFVRIQPEQQTQQKDRKPRKPPKPQEPPPPMEAMQMDAAAPDGGQSGLNFAADLSSDISLDGGLSLDSGDGEYVPITKVQAIYPRRAMQRGIQGYVIVEFTVNKTGAVQNPVVVEANPQGIFEQAALDAVIKFKYKPRMVNGEPTAVAGVQNRITFEIE
ncbi:periplasmic protein TonB [Glaciecola punicea ACAM 611]|jgi:protein TonB|uniref:Protein TonB n=1 Tax=Glaciecola punicea ACAM 611 TaxID=1121923 RepID=H5T8F1_9ALTE|nr:energy transducer TonB [Glaciecola punicea]OFA30529.1 protein TonB [Glaciecola punicea]GAB54592.1 periplasmic protein TonB [Glaciecola punicea ACAM 611]